MPRAGKTLSGTKALMAALVRMPPKPHEDMKLGERENKKARRLRKAKEKKPSRG